MEAIEKKGQQSEQHWRRVERKDEEAGGWGRERGWPTGVRGSTTRISYTGRRYPGPLRSWETKAARLGMWRDRLGPRQSRFVPSTLARPRSACCGGASVLGVRGFFYRVQDESNN
jgi:hypothetical protein